MGKKDNKRRKRKNRQRKRLSHRDQLSQHHSSAVNEDGSRPKQDENTAAVHNISSCRKAQDSNNIDDGSFLPTVDLGENQASNIATLEKHETEDNVVTTPKLLTDENEGGEKQDGTSAAISSSFTIFKVARRKRKRVDFVYPATAQAPHRLFFFPKAKMSQEKEESTFNLTNKSAGPTNTCQEDNTATYFSLTSIDDIFKKQKYRLSEEKQKKEDVKPLPNILGEDDKKANREAKEMNSALIEQQSIKSGTSSADTSSKTTAPLAAKISTSNHSDSSANKIFTPNHSDSGFQVSYGETSVKDAVLDKCGSRPRSNSTDVELNLPQRGLCDERAVLATHCWKSTGIETGWKLSELSQKYPPRGMTNLGNTCFLNATLQCLAYLPTFCQCITSLSPSPTNGNSGQKIILMMRSLLRKIHFLDVEEGGKTSSFAPRGIVNALPTLGGAKRRFRLGRQEDAHEFLVFLLDAMKDGELIEAGINPQKSGWRDRLPIARLDETTLIHRMFGGYFRSQVRCTNCEYKSNTYDPFLDLALEVSQVNMNTLSSAISYFTRKEKLDARNQWKCGGCKQRVCATKQFTIFRPPLTLCIQLKRFSFGGSWGHSAGQKICKPIQFPLSLSLPLSDKRKCEYDLTGVIVHVGGSSNSGHYMAYVKKPGRGNSYQWYHMDDSCASKVSENQVLQQSNAYILFYCRKEVKLEFPTPPARSNMSAEEASQSGKARAKARADSIASGCSEISPSGKSPETAKVNQSLADKNEPTSRQVIEPSINGFNDDSKEDSIGNTLFTKSNSRPAPPTKVVLDRGSQIGKVEVAMGRRIKSESSSPFSGTRKFGSEVFEKWGDETLESTSPRENQRKVAALSEQQARERERQKSMRLSAWDAALDEGKKKKIKKPKDIFEYSSPEPNRFHQAQSKKLNMMGNGYAKGYNTNQNQSKQHGKKSPPFRKGAFSKHQGKKGPKSWKR